MLVKSLIDAVQIIDEISKNVANWQQQCREVKFYFSTLVILCVSWN